MDLKIINTAKDKLRKILNYSEKSNVNNIKCNSLDIENDHFNIESVIVHQKIRYDDGTLPINLNEKVFFSEVYMYRIYIIYHINEKEECKEKLKEFITDNDFIFKANKDNITEYIENKYKTKINDSMFNNGNVNIMMDVSSKNYSRGYISFFSLKKDFINTDYFDRTDKLVYGYIHNDEYDYYTNIISSDKFKINSIGNKLME